MIFRIIPCTRWKLSAPAAQAYPMTITAVTEGRFDVDGHGFEACVIVRVGGREVVRAGSIVTLRQGRKVVRHSSVNLYLKGHPSRDQQFAGPAGQVSAEARRR